MVLKPPSSFITRLDKFISQTELEHSHQQSRKTYNEHFYANHKKCIYLSHATKAAGDSKALVLNAFIDNGIDSITDIDMSLLRVCKELVEDDSKISFNPQELGKLREMIEVVDYLFSAMAKSYYLIVMNNMVTLQAYGRGITNELVIRSSFLIGNDYNVVPISKDGGKDVVHFYEQVVKHMPGFTDEQAAYVKNICNDFVFLNAMVRKGMLSAIDYLERRKTDDFSLKFLTNIIYQSH